MEKIELNQKKLDQIKDVISSIQMTSLDDSLIKDNKMYFTFEGKSYRTKMPTQKDISDAHRKKDQYYSKLLQEDNSFLTEDQIKKSLKEKQGIDIYSLEEDRITLQKTLQDVYLELAMIHPDSVERIEEQKAIIKDLESQFTTLFIKITEYLQPSLEKQLEKVYIESLTTKCSEIEVNKDEWNPVWDSYDAFQNENYKLTAECVKHMTFLLIKTNR